MKVIIEQQAIKREIKGPFAICLSKEDAETLVQRLNSAINDGLVFGWISVYDEPLIKQASSTRPLQWVDASNENQQSDAASEVIP